MSDSIDLFIVKTLVLPMLYELESILDEASFSL